MMSTSRLWLTFGIAATCALVIGANWNLVTVALESHPGCVTPAPEMPAATAAC
jgi:hypothetical protein